MGTHTALMIALEAQLDSPPTNKPVPMGGGNTANYRWMRWSAELLRAQRFGTQAERDRAVVEVLALYATERREGFMTMGPIGCEQTCPDPHANFHLVSHAAIALMPGSPRVAQQTAQWWRWLVSLLLECSTHDGQVAIPGTRAKTLPPTWLIYTAVLREILGKPQDKVAEKNIAKVTRDWRSVVEVRRLKQAGYLFGLDDLVSAAAPYLRLPMTVEDRAGVKTITLANPDGLKLSDPVMRVELNEQTGLVTSERDAA